MTRSAIKGMPRSTMGAALTLRPEGPSVLSNYALSRMQAKDPAMARKLADRAEIANATAKDEKITRDIALIRSMAPDTDNKVAVNTPAPPTPVAAPHVAVNEVPLDAVRRPQPMGLANRAPDTDNKVVVNTPAPPMPVAALGVDWNDARLKRYGVHSRSAQLIGRLIPTTKSWSTRLPLPCPWPRRMWL